MTAEQQRACAAGPEAGMRLLERVCRDCEATLRAGDKVRCAECRASRRAGEWDPKKLQRRVLLYCRDEQRGSQVALVLYLRGYAVTRAESPALLGHALDFNLPFRCALVLDSGEPGHAEDAVRLVQRHPGHAPVLLQPARLCLEQTLAERTLAHGAGMDELLEAVRVMVKRNRGPVPRALNKGAQRAVAAAGKVAVA